MGRLPENIKQNSDWRVNAKWDWVNTSFMVLCPIVAVVVTVAYFVMEEINYGIIGLFVFFYFVTGIAITAGYHRLFSHKCYEVHPIIEFLYLIFGAAAFQNSALKWCTDHRIHHRYVDDEDDPYNIKEGFWYAHMGWICKSGNPKDFSRYNRDLASNKLIIWQDKYYPLIGLAVGGVLPTLLGWMLGSAFGGFALAGFLRIVVVHHFTFFINSACHWWGKQTYTDENSSKDSAFLALFTYGEGYHNFHHLFHNDYRNGIRWYDYDPTKWFIAFIAFLGGAKKLRRTSQIKILQARMAMQKKKLESKIENFDMDEIVEQMKERVERAYIDWQKVKSKYREEYQSLKKLKTEQGRERIALMKSKLKEAKSEYKLAYAQWNHYTGTLQFA